MNAILKTLLAAACAGGLLAAPLTVTGTAQAQSGSAVVAAEECTATVLDPNDDNSTEAVALPFPVDFYGQRYEQLWVNNNGNVTFDGPLGTYTPFGLADTQSVIVAPFFADVDTRAEGSDPVRYGYGTTMYQGRPAFCVNWLDVGYYRLGTDKLNSFQLLLVDRSDRRDGDVDIVFNYDQVQWETGDASGGSDGLGGSSARVGFSNGTGETGTNFELVGSGEPGAFLDGNTATGLVHRSIDSTTPGRYVFAVRNGTPPPQTWVAMGDSYQSGVGTGEYYEDSGNCQRSPHAYAPLLQERGATTYDLQFVACQGARTHHLYDGKDGEAPQFDVLEGEAGKDVALVTLGIGGNDLDFGPILRDCIESNHTWTSCEEEHDEHVGANLEALTGVPTEGTGLNRLQEVYKDARFKAYRSELLILTYPRFFPHEGGEDWTTSLIIPRCQNLRVTDQLWINGKVKELDDEIIDAALTMGALPVDLYDLSDGHELCNDDGAEEFLHGITPSNLFRDSFHPTRFGYQAIADRLETEFTRLGVPTDHGLWQELVLAQDETVSVPFEVAADSPGAGFSTSWPGSDVVMTLRSPSGRTIQRSTEAEDVLHEVAPTRELYYIQDPEPGQWTIELFGADVAASGEDVTLTAYAAQPRNERPKAAFSMTQQGRTVTLDGSASTDPDGQIVSYIWEFDDGTVKEGPAVEHTYTEDGSYRVTLAVVDDREAVDVASAESPVVISRYAVEGFFSPVSPMPAMNGVKAGRAIPLKFSLGGDHGLDILAAGSPASREVDCSIGDGLSDMEEAQTAGQSELSYDQTTGQYTYVWKTEPGWSGQCRELTVTLDDGSSITALFTFR